MHPLKGYTHLSWWNHDPLIRWHASSRQGNSLCL